ncbi:hypothetical protein [Almyronema epifaneia]|uniref:Uncharacterized protein n=1 Tax=Almyronema epifaneia S1 TaxID=2991925 RepID=A0ABW6ICK6_9CYAN
MIRWLRPEYQAPETIEAEPQQTVLDVIAQEEPIVEPVEQQQWPSQPKEQLAAIRDLLRTSSGEWTVKQLAAQFKGRITQKKLEAITANLERLEWFGLAFVKRLQRSIARTENDLTYWQFTESAQAA